MKIFLLPILFLFSFPVLSQSFITRDIKSFGAKGDGKTNDHEAFQRAAAYFNERGGNGKLVISKGNYIVGKQKFNKNTTTVQVYQGSDVLAFVNVNNLTIEGESGSKLTFQDGLFYGAFDPKTGKPLIKKKGFFAKVPYMAIIGHAISLKNSSNVIIQNLELDGNNGELILGGTYGDTGYQIPHSGIFIVNSRKTTINKIHSHHFGQDGIMLSNQVRTDNKKDEIVITNSTFEYNSRQGFSWIGGNDLLVVNSKFNHTGRGKFFSRPAAGVDIESEKGPISNGRFEKCEFINNTGAGLLADSGPSSNCTFTDCTFWGVTNWAVWITKPAYTIKDSRIYGSFVHGFDAEKDADATRFVNCHFEDKPYNGKEPYGKFLIESNKRRRVSFINCTMVANKKKIMWLDGATNWTPEEKYQLRGCTILFKGDFLPSGNWVAVTRSVRYKDNEIEIRHPEANKRNMFLNGLGKTYNKDLGGNRIIRNKEVVNSVIDRW